MRLALVLLIPLAAPAQWTLQSSSTTASLRGIHAVSDQIAWASGTSGTVLHTTDGGAHWLPCAIPPQADHLDFRGIQAFDAQTAIVMSSGKGDLSRLYKTTDACQTWALVFTNPDKEGFWDALRFDPYGGAVTILGDPVDGRFVIVRTTDQGAHWLPVVSPAKIPKSRAKGEAVFAASNNSLYVDERQFSTIFVTGGSSGSRILFTRFRDFFDTGGSLTFQQEELPIGVKTETSGAFSFAYHDCLPTIVQNKAIFCPAVVVGGDYKQPDEPRGTAAFAQLSALHGESKTWTAATTPPRNPGSP